MNRRGYAGLLAGCVVMSGMPALLGGQPQARGTVGGDVREASVYAAVAGREGAAQLRLEPAAGRADTITRAEARRLAQEQAALAAQAQAQAAAAQAQAQAAAAQAQARAAADAQAQARAQAPAGVSRSASRGAPAAPSTGSVAGVRQLVIATFGVEVSALGAGGGDHARGKALDVMVQGALGDRIAEWAVANRQSLGINYVIWRQRIWSVERAGEGWRHMPNRGSATANHYDHVHLNFF